MNIEYLHYFIDVAKTKSITQAAKLNFISPQGMSRAMNELEKELGCQLLIRYSNKLSLSETGEEMIPRAEEIIDRYTEMLDFATTKSRAAASKNSSILLECQAVAMLALFDKKTKDYVFDCPDIHFREAQNSQIRQNLLSISEGKASDANPTIGLMGFFNQERASDSDGIADLQKRGYIYRPYLKTFDKVIVSSHSKLAEKETLTDEEILTRAIVSSNSHLYNTLSRRYGRDAISLSSPDFNLRKRMVERDAAVSFLPAIAQLTLADSEGIAFCAMERPYEVEVGFIGLEQDMASECFENFKRILDEFYSAHLDSGLYTLCS